MIGGGHTSTPHPHLGGLIFRTPAKPDVSSIHLEPESFDVTVNIMQEPTISPEDLGRFAKRTKEAAEEYEQKKVRLIFQHISLLVYYNCISVSSPLLHT